MGWGKQKGREVFRERQGGTQLFKLNLGVKKDKNGDFKRQISVNFFKNLPAAAHNTHSLAIYCAMV